MWRHKILTVIAIFILLALLGSVLPDPEKDSAGDDSSVADVQDDESTDGATEEPEEATDAAESAEPDDPRDVWKANYAAKEAILFRALNRRAPDYKPPRDAVNEVVGTCDEIVEGKGIYKRLTTTARRWTDRGAPTQDQALVIIDVTVKYICPEVSKAHTDQVAVAEAQAKAKAARIAARAEARRKAAAAAAAKAAREEARRQVREDQQQEADTSVYYANCTEVENAGAAPIYTGDPGYSRDLDRDGDGVACEQ
jgi:hypothetical protein